MSRKTLNLTSKLYEYLLSVSLREPRLLRRLREETAGLEMANMQISPEQGQFMGLLVELLQARDIIEVGTFTGYSSLCMAMAMPDDGRLICCDVSKEWTDIARRYWQEAGIEDRIDLRLAPAEDTLQELLNNGETGGFDMVFMDADKESYLVYYELGLSLLRPGGLLLADNTLWGGSVAETDETSASTRAIRQFNETLYQDDRISLSLLPVGDGLTLARKH
ncbi:MAG TPA: class I SAM-dependent methyltransferase [Gammaproteobacteria bacterium]|jgi:predicted O-methyltransferase YrrM